MHNRVAQRGGLLGRIILGLFVLALVGAGVVGYVAYDAYREIKADGPLPSQSILWIERGNSVTAVASKLKDMGAISDERLFSIASRINELAPALQAGEYEIPAGASMEDIIRLLKEGKPLLRFVTIPEGLTTKQIVDRIAQTDLLEGEITVSPVEGALLPETYSYQRGDSRNSVVERMAAAHDAALSELWAGRAEGLPFKTPAEAVILASIVEKETGIADERPLVASVFVNRLKHRPPMRLQSDPTIIYGLTGGEPLGRGIRRSELDRVTPYNTYKINGLPPTPIANPGKAALAAVLNPPDTDYLYFVADGSGGHAFASSYSEHRRNAAKWRRIESAAAGTAKAP